MPVHRMNMRKSPRNTAEAKTVGDPGVLINVTRIIVVDELVPERLPKNCPGKHGQGNANAGNKPAAAGFAESD